MYPNIVQKINYNKWINTSLKYSDDKIIDVLYLMFCNLCNIMDKYKDIDFYNKYNLFQLFCNHFYDEYVTPYKPNNVFYTNDSEYIELFCEDDIVNIFDYFNQNFNIFNTDATSYPLLVFILNNSYIIEDCIDSEDDLFYD